MVKDMLSAVMYQRNRLLFINLPVLHQIELNNIILEKKLNDNCSCHTWNEVDDAFDKQLEKWGVEKVFLDQSERSKRKLRAYIQY